MTTKTTNPTLQRALNPKSPRDHHVVITGDSLKILKQLPSASVDLICTDPPYNLGTYSTGNIELGWRKDFNNDIASWDQGSFEPHRFSSQLTRVLKPTGNLFIFTSYNLLGVWHELLDPVFDTFQFMVWHKTNPPPKFRRAGFLNSCELIVCAWNKGHTWNFSKQSEMHNFIESPICGGRERIRDPYHPTQKPVVILKKIIEMASNPGQLVLDPFAGVGSTAVAAKSLGRRSISVEMLAHYSQASRSRLQLTTPCND